jgi:glutamate dehydrogenase
VTTLEEKSDTLERLADYARAQAHGRDPGGSKVDLAEFAGAVYKNVDAEDLAERTPEELYGAVQTQLRLAQSLPQGKAQVKVFTPTVAANGWSAGGHTVIGVITNDMPFLVDSVTMAINAEQHAIHLLVHPVLAVRRDVTGELVEVLPVESAESTPEFHRESWMYVEIDRVPPEQLEAMVSRLKKVLSDVRESVEDWSRMHQQIDRIIGDLRENPPPIPADDLERGIALLEWLSNDHFAFLGYREYDLERVGDEEHLIAVPGTGYGILRADPKGPRVLPPNAAKHARDKELLVLAKANSRATVHRPVHLDYVGVKRFDKDGNVNGERRFLGLLSSAAYTDSITRIPLLREKAQLLLDRAGFEPTGHDGKALLDVLETYPRDELFQTSVDELLPIVSQVVHSRDRRQLRLFLRRDRYGRFFSCLVYLPRDRYNTTVRERIAEILKQALNGESVDYTAHVGESSAARLHFVVRPRPGEDIPEPNVEELERRCAAAARSWRDDFTSAVVAAYGEEQGSQLARVYAGCFPESYKEAFLAASGAVDLGLIESIQGDEGIRLSLYEQPDAPPGVVRLKIFRVGSPLSLSDVLPLLSTTGVEVTDERPFPLEGLDKPTHIYDFGLRWPGEFPEGARERFQDTITAVWDGRNEGDGFNALVLRAGLTWRQASVLRAVAKYMRQGGTPFAQDYIEGALNGNVEITRRLVALFETRVDPSSGPADSPQRQESCARIQGEIQELLDAVSSLDHDRILRSYLTTINATLRTSYFQTDADGQPLDRMSFKIDPMQIPDLPEPRPKFEIFVYSPRVEGVHLRFGKVARGGLRWSDRRDDFRTEILGLVKAQMVKNTVIVPGGAKGGFFCKQLPDSSNRDAWLNEGISCYKCFISGLLDITDNLVDGEVVPPNDVCRHDGDDPYLVVAADKGTATFSDIANGVSNDYGFWLGDAFASGGSAGYDHKAMGITARGAWVSVRRHFREMGIDSQKEEFTCVGIGDMSGDVFGNGLLCSETTKLVAAFDHRDIFVDPSPDAKVSYRERRRLFDLPRSSWQDYDKSLISKGGGVFSRSAKSIPISEEMKQVLGIEDDHLTPVELMRAVLRAPVDLLWNGGIGTYVKGADESSSDVGDKANDAIRVNGVELRASCVGEGGNLGFTQRGRIEYALHGGMPDPLDPDERQGGRINTDFIDNSAGVDTSDHEVNIKILLNGVVTDGDLTTKQRNALLAEMTNEVGNLVLIDNYEQNLALASSVEQSAALLHVHEDWMRRLERDGILNRELEALPSRREVAARIERKQGLTTPELAVLFAYTKIALEEKLLESDIADDDFLRGLLISYFPVQMRQDYRAVMEKHRLRREIIVCQVVNKLVNRAGISFYHRLAGETSANAADITRANFVARELFGADRLYRDISAYDNQISAAAQTRMRLELRTLVERASRWFLNNRVLDEGTEEVVSRYEVVVEQVTAQLPELMVGAELEAYESRRDTLVGRGVTRALAQEIAVCPPAYMVLGIVTNAARIGMDPVEVGRRHFEVGEQLGLPALVNRILALPRNDRWQTMARAALRDDLHAVHAQLTAQTLEGEPLTGDHVAKAVTTLSEICSDDDADLARLSVGLRVVRSLLTTS